MEQVGEADGVEPEVDQDDGYGSMVAAGAGSKDAMTAQKAEGGGSGCAEGKREVSRQPHFTPPPPPSMSSWRLGLIGGEEAEEGIWPRRPGRNLRGRNSGPDTHAHCS